jgi:hypothetical protein
MLQGLLMHHDLLQLYLLLIFLCLFDLRLTFFYLFLYLDLKFMNYVLTQKKTLLNLSIFQSVFAFTIALLKGCLYLMLLLLFLVWRHTDVFFIISCYKLLFLGSTLFSLLVWSLQLCGHMTLSITNDTSTIITLFELLIFTFNLSVLKRNTTKTVVVNNLPMMILLIPQIHLSGWL